MIIQTYDGTGDDIVCWMTFELEWTDIEGNSVEIYEQIYAQIVFEDWNG